MRDRRNLSQEELELLQARAPEPMLDSLDPALAEPVARPVAQWENYERTGELRSLPVPEERQERGAFDALHSVGDRLKAQRALEGDDGGFLDPWEADPWKIGSVSVPNLFATVWNLPGSVARGAGELASTVSPWHIGKELGRRAAIASFANEAAGEDDRIYRYYHDFLIEHTDSQLTEEQETLVTLASEVFGPFLEATLANPYDPANVDLFDPDKTAERMSLVHAVGEQIEGVLPVTPWDGDYNPEWSENLSRMIQEESGEIVLEVGLGAVSGGGGLVSSAVRRTTGAVRQGVRQVASDIRMEGVFDLDDVDLMTGRDYGQQRRAATVELDYVQQHRSVHGATGGVIQDPETGRTFISTAAHFVVGKGQRVVDEAGELLRIEGQPVDFSGIRARTEGGEIGTVTGVSAIDLERDVALLEVTGLSGSLDLPDASLSDARTLLGREGALTETRVVGDTGAYLETGTAVGVKRESGAPVIGGGTQIAGVYLGTVGDLGVYAPGSVVSELLGQVGDRNVRLGRELSQRAVREGLFHRYTLEDPGVGLVNQVPGAEIIPFVPDVASPDILMPQFEAASVEPELHSLDPDEQWGDILTEMIGEMEERKTADFESELLHVEKPLMQSARESTFSVADPLADVFSRVSDDPGLFFAIGRRYQDEEGSYFRHRAFSDREQTRRYRRFMEESAPWDEFDFERGSVLVPPGRLLSAGGEASEHPHVLREGVVGFRDITELGQALSQLKDVSAEDFSLQIVRGLESSKADLGLDFSGRPFSFVFQAESVLELDLPKLSELRDVYGEIRESGGSLISSGMPVVFRVILRGYEIGMLKVVLRCLCRGTIFLLNWACLGCRLLDILRVKWLLSMKKFSLQDVHRRVQGDR